MQLSDEDLRKRHVMTADGRRIGKAHGVEFNAETRKITAIIVALDKEIAKELGAKRPLVGKAHLRLPISDVSGIADAVVLSCSYGDLQSV